MRLIVIGCEYTGKTTLAARILQWIETNMGHPLCGWHDHFVLPFAEGPEPDATEEADQIYALKPKLLEKYSRYMIEYHLNDAFYGDNHHLLVNWYYADVVYAPFYYGFGGKDQYADRQAMARGHDGLVEAKGPDTVLIHLKATPEVIRQRMAAGLHVRCILKGRENDVDAIVKRFQEEFDRSGIRRRFELDTTTATPEETFQGFLKGIEPHLTMPDMLQMLRHAK